MRGIAQTISYEVIFALVLLFFLILSKRINILTLVSINTFWAKGLIFLPLVGIILISALAETNRTPFDFAEGESELVSGFNVEYGRLNFALIFIAEYARILLIRCFLVSILFYYNSFIIIIVTVLILSAFIWIRTTFPRYRYDKLINLAWKVYLPLRLFTLFIPLIIIII
jgi:NADH-ubiquinone oxidoreductase chain 1